MKAAYSARCIVPASACARVRAFASRNIFLGGSLKRLKERPHAAEHLRPEHCLFTLLLLADRLPGTFTSESVRSRGICLKASLLAQSPVLERKRSRDKMGTDIFSFNVLLLKC